MTAFRPITHRPITHRPITHPLRLLFSLLLPAGIASGGVCVRCAVVNECYTGDIGADGAGFSEGSCSGMGGKELELELELELARGSSPILFWRLGREGEGDAYRDTLGSCDSSFPRSEMRYFSRIARSAATCLNSDSI